MRWKDTDEKRKAQSFADVLVPKDIKIFVFTVILSKVEVYDL